MSTHHAGKAIDRSNPWSEPMWDKRGFWYCSRFVDGNEQFYYPSNGDPANFEHQELLEEKSPSTPRNQRNTKIPDTLLTFGSSPLSTSGSPTFTHDVSATTQYSTPKYRNELANSMSNDEANSLNSRFQRSTINSSLQQPAHPSYFSGNLSNGLGGNASVDVMGHGWPQTAARSPPEGASYGPSTSKRYTNSSQGYSSSILDERYKTISNKRLDKFWKVGRVFSTLWTEPARDDVQIPPPGSKTGGPRSDAASRLEIVRQQTEAGYLRGVGHWKIRRFVVVRKNWGNTICCPIHTYENQACLKPGLPDVKKHVIIYTDKEAPKEQSKKIAGKVVKEGLTLTAIRVVSEDEGDLGVMSRVNLCKLYTVEMYAKVLNIGYVHPNSLERLTRYVERVGNEPCEGPDPKKRPSGH